MSRDCRNIECEMKVQQLRWVILDFKLSPTKKPIYQTSGCHGRHCYQSVFVSFHGIPSIKKKWVPWRLGPGKMKVPTHGFQVVSALFEDPLFFLEVKVPTGRYLEGNTMEVSWCQRVSWSCSHFDVSWHVWLDLLHIFVSPVVLRLDECSTDVEGIEFVEKQHWKLRKNSSLRECRQCGM